MSEPTTDLNFDAIHRRYDPGLRRFVAKRAGAPELVDEIVQQTWTEVWRALCEGRYDPSRGAISTFIYAVAYKRWLQVRRVAASGPRFVSESDSVFERLLTESSPDNAVHAAELLDALRGCLGNATGPFSLSDQERAAAGVAASEETERTLASRLGVAPSTVHAWKRAALEKLRNCLGYKGFVGWNAEQPRSSRE